nr:glutamine synthetase family protein [bacterium]
MELTRAEVLSFVAENDVKFIKLSFTDVLGRQLNVSILPTELERAFESGISFDPSAVAGFEAADGADLFLVPDPSTLSILPWRPSHGRVIRFFCDIRLADGTPFACDGRQALKGAVARAERMGYTCMLGTACEFYLFNRDDMGNPTCIPFDRAGYLAIAPEDRGENVRREICLTLEEMGIAPETSHHERGPGQNEIDFHFASALQAADNLASFKAAVKAIAERNGLFASFMPKPLPDVPSSGMHVNLSLYRDGENMFKTGTQHSAQSESYLAGILERLSEITAFLNPTANSYRRFESGETPTQVSWGRGRNHLVRIPAAQGPFARMEIRSPDGCASPYLAFALLMHAGLDGIENGLALPPMGQSLGSLPGNLGQALETAGSSAFVRRVLPGELLEGFMASEEAAWRAWQSAGSAEQADHALYFDKT